MNILDVLEAAYYVTPEAPQVPVPVLRAVLAEPEGVFRDQLDGHRNSMKEVPPQGWTLNKSLAPHRLLAWRKDGYKSGEAFDWVVKAVDELWQQGRDSMRVSRTVLVYQAEADGFKPDDVQVAIACLGATRRCFQLQGEDIVPFRNRPSTSTSYARLEAAAEVPVPPSLRTAVNELRRVMDERAHGRAIEAEPVMAFCEKLDVLGQGRFRAWWAAKVRELDSTNPHHQQTAYLVLCAALAEAALSFMVRPAIGAGLSMTMKSLSERRPDQWRFPDLIKGARGGSAALVDDNRLNGDLERLCEWRRDIHAGAYLEAAGPVPLVTPEKCRQARAAVDNLLRALLRWMDAHPEVFDAENDRGCTS